MLWACECDSSHDANDLLVRLSVYVFGEATVDMFDEAEMTWMYVFVEAAICLC